MAKGRKTFADTIAKDDLFKKTEKEMVLENQITIFSEEEQKNKLVIEPKKQSGTKKTLEKKGTTVANITNDKPSTLNTDVIGDSLVTPELEKALEIVAPIYPLEVDEKDDKEKIKEKGGRKRKHEIPVVYQGLYLTEELVKSINLIATIKNKDKSLVVREILLADPTVQKAIDQLLNISL